MCLLFGVQVQPGTPLLECGGGILPLYVSVMVMEFSYEVAPRSGEFPFLRNMPNAAEPALDFEIVVSARGAPL